jgi:hypothetical protein
MIVVMMMIPPDRHETRYCLFVKTSGAAALCFPVGDVMAIARWETVLAAALTFDSFDTESAFCRFCSA